MTPDQILKAVDLTELVASRIPSGGVARTIVQSTRYFWAVRKELRFLVVLRITLGSKGGAVGHVYLRDLEISPAVDSIRVGEIPEFGSHKLLSFSGLFRKRDEKHIPDESVILNFLKRKVAELPDDAKFYEELFFHGSFDTPAKSITGWQGGAPGLRSSSS